MSDLVDRLLDENYRGAFQHLRSCTEIDNLLSEAATEITRLQKELETAREDALEEAASVADEAEQMRLRLFNENGGSINAAKADQAGLLAAEIRRLKDKEVAG